jgi:hypothetical protein
VPHSAADLVAIAAARLQTFASAHEASANHVPKKVRAQLIALMRSYKLATSVTDDGFALKVETRTGIGAALFYKGRLAPTPGQLQASLKAEAGWWGALLRSGGLLILSSSTTVEIPAVRARMVLSGIEGVARVPGKGRLPLLTDLVHDPGVARDFLDARPLPRALLHRFHVRVGPPVTRAQTSRAILLAQGAPADSTAASHTPIHDTAYFFTAVTGAASEEAPVVNAAMLHHYDVVQYSYSGICSPGSATIANFIGTTGKAGVLYITAHGSATSIAIEAHCSKADAAAAAKQYAASGTVLPRDIQLGASAWTSLGGRWWYVDITDKGIQHLWQDANTIVELSSCATLNLDQRFNAREFIAPADLVTDIPSENESLWDRIAGIQDNGTKRNVGDAFAASEFPTAPGKWALISKAKGRTVLSPAVVSVLPAPGTPFLVGQKITERVTFDTPIAASSASVQHDFDISTIFDIPAGDSCHGKWNAEPDHWLDDHTVEVTWTPQAVGVENISIVASRTWSGDAATGHSTPQMDGNQDPAGTDHVGPNGDDYVYQHPCVLTLASTPASLPTLTPTPTATPTATPSTTQLYEFSFSGFAASWDWQGFLPGTESEKIAGTACGADPLSAPWSIQGTSDPGATNTWPANFATSNPYHVFDVILQGYGQVSFYLHVVTGASPQMELTAKPSGNAVNLSFGPPQVPIQAQPVNAC